MGSVAYLRRSRDCYAPGQDGSLSSSAMIREACSMIDALDCPDVPGRRIAKSLFPCPDEVESLAEVSPQVVGTSADRKVFYARDQPQRGQGRVSQHRQAFRQTRATTPLPILVPPPILEEMKPVLDRPMATHQLHQPLRAHLVRAQARDQVARLASAHHSRLA